MKKLSACVISCGVVLLSVCLVMPSQATASTALSKMDLPLRMLMDRPITGKAIVGKAVTVRDGTEQVDLLIKSLDPELTKEAIQASGGTVRTVIGHILTAFLPLTAIQEIASLPEVVALESSKPMQLLMDTSRSSVNTDVASVQSTYDGENVVVGTIDSGLDYSRDDFRDANDETRVQYLRFQSASSSGLSIVQCAKDRIDAGSCAVGADNDSMVGHGTHIMGIAAGNDSTYTGIAPKADLMIVRNDFLDDINEGGTDSGTFSGGVVDGVVEIFSKADILDKPAVINISQGTHIGAHDNTSLMEEALNSAVQGDYATNGKSYGRAIVAAAGNEHIVEDGLGEFKNYAGGIHAPINLLAGDAHAWRLWILSSGGGTPARTPLVMDAWFGLGQEENCSIAANAYQYSDLFQNPFITAKASVSTSDARASIDDMPLSSDASDDADDGTVAILIETASEDGQNGRPRALIGFGPSNGASWSDIDLTNENTNPASLNVNGYLLDVIVRASGSGPCTGHMWLEGGSSLVHFMEGLSTNAFDIEGGDHGAMYAMQDGDNESIVTIPATASGVIGVGAYMQSKPVATCGDSCWTDIDGVVHDAEMDPGSNAPEAEAAQINGGTAQEVTPFSSVGPAVYSYAGKKPDLLAPGDPIISVLASGLGVNDEVKVDATHFKGQGTSQASPHVAGIVALLFQKNNTLTASQVKQALVQTATRAGSPDDIHGAGNVKAAAALASISADTSGYSGTGDLSQADIGDSGGGGDDTSSGCGGTLAPVSTAGAGPASFVLMLPMLAMLIRRRKS